MAYKVFQNGYPLTAAELNNYLMNQTVMVFASATERDSVLTSPVEGMITYLQDSNLLRSYDGSAWVDVNDNTDAISKTIFEAAGDLIVASAADTPTRLPIGTNGQVLTSNGTTATWSSPSGSGGKTLLSTTTVSGTATTISSISQSYKSLEIIISGISLSTAGWLRIQTNDGNYNIATLGNTGNTPTTMYQSTTAWLVTASPYILKASDTNNSWSITIDDYASTTKYKPVSIYGGYTENNYSGQNAFFGFGHVTNNTAVTGIYLSSSATMSLGTVRIYGVN